MWQVVVATCSEGGCHGLLLCNFYWDVDLLWLVNQSWSTSPGYTDVACTVNEVLLEAAAQFLLWL
jgi:hypothetical protein